MQMVPHAALIASESPNKRLYTSANRSRVIAGPPVHASASCWSLLTVYCVSLLALHADIDVCLPGTASKVFHCPPLRREHCLLWDAKLAAALSG